MERFSTLHFHLTSRCSYRCQHCSADAGPHGEEGTLRLDEIRRMLEEAKDSGAVFFDVSGGDPLSRGKRFLLETIRSAAQNGLEPSISTNAENLSEKYAKKLAKAGLQKIKISLYGVSPETHDDFTRVPGSFEKATHGIRLSKQAGLEVWVNAVVTPANLLGFQKLPSLLEPLGVDLVQLSSVVPSGRGEVARSLRFSEDGLERAIEMLQQRISSVDYAFTNTMFPDPRRPPFDGRYCDYLLDRLVVDPNGNVIPCCLLPRDLQHHLGNIREALNEVYSDKRIHRDWVFSWLAQGHEAIREELDYPGMSHNLCTTCIDMLYSLRNKIIGNEKERRNVDSAYTRAKIARFLSNCQ